MFPKTHLNQIIEEEIDTIFYRRTAKIYHYTNIEGLFNIISKRCLLATHIRYLNDLSEYEAGYSILRECLCNNNKILALNKYNSSDLNLLPQKLPKRSLYPEVLNKFDNSYLSLFIKRNILSEVYTISFCTQPDSLNHWITYAKEEGICIEFDFTNFQFLDYSMQEQRRELIENGISIEEIFQSSIFNNSIPRVVTYIKKDNEIIKDTINKLIQPIIESQEMDPNDNNIQAIFWDSIRQFFEMVPFIKTSPFHKEEEVRIAFREKETPVYTNSGISSLTTNIQHRIKNHIIIPYILVGWISKDKTAYPIKSITIGPGKNQQVVFDSIVSFIEKQDKSIINSINVKDYGRKNSYYETKNGIKIKLSDIKYIF